jgi:phage FluMu gp28-like protein
MIVKGFVPHPDQRVKIDAMLHEEVKYIVLTTGRQWGKTLLAQNLLIKWAVETPNQILMWVSPVYSQARKVFDSLVNAGMETGLIAEANKSNLIIKMVNGSVIHFKSGERADSIRGFTLDYLIVDEAAFFKDEVWNMVLKPTILVKGKKVLFISTPKGKNYLYSLSIRGNDPEQPTYLALQGSSYDTPYISQDELNEAKKTLPEDIFRQEILGEFIDSGGEVFVDLERYCVLDFYPSKNEKKKYWAGVDFGRQNDYSVLTIFDDDGNLVYFYRERQKAWADIIGNIAQKLREYDAQAQVEVNSIGDVLFEQLKTKYNKVEPFITSQSSKQNIVEDFIYATNEGLVKLPTHELNPSLYNELKTFSYEYSIKTRRISYAAINGAHDDIIMSLCIAYNTLKERKTKGAYFIY